jgi:RNA polymerase sigma-70 factor, ECF subfamily
VLGLSEPNTRQLASRARRHLAGDRRVAVDTAEHQRLLEAVVAAAESGQLDAREQILVADIHAGVDDVTRRSA